MKEWITSLVGAEWAEVTYFAIIALSVVVTLLLVFMIYKFIRRPVYERGRRGKQARLAVTDAAAIDDRRRLVLLRRDDIEHLILIGGPTDIVIESDIRKNAPARPLNTPPSPLPSTAKPATSSNSAPTPPQQPAQKISEPAPPPPRAHQNAPALPTAPPKPATQTERRESLSEEATVPAARQTTSSLKPDPKPEAVKPEVQKIEPVPSKPKVSISSTNEFAGAAPSATSKKDDPTKDAMDALLDEITQPRT